ncbi:MAG: MFS transporter [Candidatus Hydrothermia bacterium]
MPEGESKIKKAFRSLSYYNFRLYFIGQSISLIGTWMQRVTVPWVVYKLTNSPFWLGMAGFASQLPTFLLSPIAGAVVDRTNRYKLLFITQTIAMLQAVALYLFYKTGHISVFLIILLNIILGIVNAFDMPARQSLLIHLVEGKENLNNAIALNSSMVNFARLIGPSIAGIIMSTLGESMCFLINAVSYLFVIICLALMKISLPESKKSEKHFIEDFLEGFHYIRENPPLKYAISLLALVSLIGMPYTVLLPVFAKEILGGGPHTYGFLMGAVGIGALLGALNMASKTDPAGIGRNIPIACFIFGGALVVTSRATYFPLVLILIALVGLGMVTETISTNTFLQLYTDDEKRGRVMSFYTLAFTGMTPFGSLIAGILAQSQGVKNTLLLSGLVVIVGGLFFLRKIPNLQKKATYFLD